MIKKFDLFKKKEKRKLKLDFQKDSSIEDPYGEESWDRTGIFDEIDIKKETYQNSEELGYYLRLSNGKYFMIGYKNDRGYNFTTEMFLNSSTYSTKTGISKKINLVDTNEEDIQGLKNEFQRLEGFRVARLGFMEIPYPAQRVFDKLILLYELEL
jgi:hypothetical protein